ncbi:hypothetical protein PENSPDRAFT_667398 [Peniophora sp. CONT]|nr:hypothetical protein PENSPDRAFT_667398 [Peniophora sp. CONT]
MFARLSILAALVAFADAQFTVNTPTATGATGAAQCESYQVTWMGGTGPFIIRLLDNEQKFVEDITSYALSSPVQWSPVNKPAGQQFFLVVHEANGGLATSALFTVQGSTNTACLGDSVTGVSSSLPVVITPGPASSTVVSTTSSAASRTSSLPASISKAAPSASSSASLNPSNALPEGAIAGIAAGAGSGALVVLVGVVWIVRRSRRAASTVSDASHEAARSVVTSVEPFPLSRPGTQRLGPIRTGTRTPVGWERKSGQDGGPGTVERSTTAALEDTAHHVLPRTDSPPETGPPGELSETVIDRLVNQVLRRLQTQEAPPSYPASSHPGTND